VQPPDGADEVLEGLTEMGDDDETGAEVVEGLAEVEVEAGGTALELLLPEPEPLQEKTGGPGIT